MGQVAAQHMTIHETGHKQTSPARVQMEDFEIRNGVRFADDDSLAGSARRTGKGTVPPVPLQP
ncbi:hypothetical protein BUE93_04385 [Chromobacterium amazonense]|uniref:Uncharacterized protein n=1 Tax=Chromobacterium amazonense TaxID=1382803 RepID=A0A2S9X840_9NEIS|nr:hypothetical protein BUE93_04385 [Chromobacterium amazonense]